ncbi:hypothetical protein GGS23DRAFT_552847 [Durotheca rogersii]|uniref:uncharacterized protein n=1 Tax=Durotheca rogersii TaxID=419775 RepID=UPI00221F6454|nr:uncharacterized protein GGS23DRAFT_552847 [Durotheca rogersii]KAI5866950.1 hypothetical protein GGS23DRAFT_552847 [Durotheca rogersii]
MFRPFVTGVAFGSALSAAAIYLPDVIVEQMTFHNWHMVTTFLTASGTSTLVVNVFRRLGYVILSPRGFSTINLFGPLDGNIIGGCILGAGMTVSGACPGTVYAQIGAGVRSGLYTLGGAMLGGVFWTGFLRPIIHRRKKAATEGADAENHPLALDEWLGTSQLTALVAVETLFAGLVASIVYLFSPGSSGLVGSVTGGVLIAGAQLLSIVTRKSLLGTSSSFDEVGDSFWWAMGRAPKPKSYNSVALTAGMTVGALAISLVSPAAQTAVGITIGPVRAVLGGILLAVGSRMAGGCTSGHGISGISLLSVSSFVTVAAMFAGGVGVAAIMG